MQHFYSPALYFKKEDFHLFGWQLMIFKTIEITNIEPFKNEHNFRLWIFIGQRSDKANYFICRDRTKAVYGKVLEFYDSNPWINEEYGEEVGADNFAEFVGLLLDGNIN